MFKIGEKVFIKDYKTSGGQCVPILRPAEIAQKFTDNPEAEQVIFLDEKFRKGGRAPNSVTVLSKLIVKEG